MVARGNKWMWVTLLATLSIGVAAGVLLDRLVLVPTVSSSDRNARDRDRHDNHGERLAERLRRELDLSQEQAATLQGVIEGNHEKAHQFWRESRAEFDDLRQQFRDDIRQHLTDEQRVRYDRLLAEIDARRESERRERNGH